MQTFSVDKDIRLRRHKIENRGRPSFPFQVYVVEHEKANTKTNGSHR